MSDAGLPYIPGCCQCSVVTSYPQEAEPSVTFVQWLWFSEPKGGGAATGGANGSAAGSPPGSAPPIGGLFTGGVPKLRPVGDGSSGRSPSTRAAAPRPPSHRHDDTESPSPQAQSPMEASRSQRPSLPNLSSSPSPSSPSSAASSPSTTMKHSSSAPPPPPPLCRRGGNPASSSLAPPPPPYRITNGPTGGEAAPELPQRHNSLSNKRTAPSPGGHTPPEAPPLLLLLPPHPLPTGRQQAAAPRQRDASASCVQSSGGRVEEKPRLLLLTGHMVAPPSPLNPPSKGSLLPAHPHPRCSSPPPPPLRNGHASSSIPRSFVDEYRHFAKIYPSKANRGTTGSGSVVQLCECVSLRRR
ncbi:WAS/WASL-interacting protein family member 2 [Collichthys lucidus]|uniref:WAS/WASL-interacting protein family member 2 n=1 Tax=Collichthys lucidus TaxID=240159 RepID=A0A4U5VRF4_COLLU|nr:WAS/WASL-interacting protein family member 2 [Collichthys lucidus]